MDVEKELKEMYKKFLSEGMTEDDAFSEAYAYMCNKYEDTEFENYLP